MTELVVRSQCRSIIRQAAESFLNLTFPLWGVASPLAILVMLLGVVGINQAGVHNGLDPKIAELLAYIGVCLCSSLVCLLSKRALGQDYFVVDERGIQLPRLLGASVNVCSYVPWRDILTIKAELSGTDVSKCRLVICKKKRANAAVSEAF